ncbi:hypothetical protein LOTGIDRAFT_110702, partial [Lottia gigantea]
KLSKSLSWLLRHGAEKEGFKYLPGGFLYVDEVLKKDQFKNYTEDDIKHVVAVNEKNRFAIKDDRESGRLLIRANQGHSIQVDDLELTLVDNADDYPTVVHGTNLTAWSSIKTQGLSRRNRNHIHFAIGEPGENGVISGMRQSSEVVIYLNLQKVLQDNIKVYKSVNNVILSPGDQHGFIPSSYFTQVLNRKTSRFLLLFCHYTQ